MFAVCITRPVPGIAKYSARCRAEFQANVATRPSSDTPNASRAAAIRRASSRTSSLGGASSVSALTGGYHAAFIGGAICAVLAAVVGVTLLHEAPMPAHGHGEMPGAEPALAPIRMDCRYTFRVRASGVSGMAGRTLSLSQAARPDWIRRT